MFTLFFSSALTSNSILQTVADCPLPPDLAKHSEIDYHQHYKTTTGTAHDFKTPGGPYSNQSPSYKKAPALYKVNCVNDHHDKLQAGGWKKPLTMGHQTSETHEQFRAQPDILAERPREFDLNPQGFILSNHLTDGPSKVWAFLAYIKPLNVDLTHHNLTLIQWLFLFCSVESSSNNWEWEDERETILCEG